MDLTKKIGWRLREVRTGQDLSLAELFVRTGDVLSKSRISNYEQGLRRPGIEEAQTLAAALGTVSATYLLCFDDGGFLSEEGRCSSSGSGRRMRGGERSCLQLLNRRLIGRNVSSIFPVSVLTRFIDVLLGRRGRDALGESGARG